MTLFLLSFFAGVLTVASPCVLPMLPVIVGSMAATQEKRKPLLIALSLSVSIVAFTLALKWSTTLLNIPSMVWASLSGGIIVVLGTTFLLPHLWTRLMITLRIEQHSQHTLQNSARVHSSWLQPVLTGAALGPVFASCSPTYFFILATVLPNNFAVGVLHLVLYALGLSVTLLCVALLGRRATQRMASLANPDGAFRRLLGIVLIIVGACIMTGIDKKIESVLLEKGFSATRIESAILDRFLDGADEKTDTDSPRMNVASPRYAPELVGLTDWINSEPLTLESLRGKVVLIDFWTYSCINCVRTLPYLNAWHTTYADDGLVIIGVHAPEFAFEHIPSNVQSAVDAYDIPYPVALDNDFLTWRAYNNRYWPAKYFIDRQGKLRHTHFGEGAYTESEDIIRALLAEDDVTLGEKALASEPSIPASRAQTPETYFGSARADHFKNDAALINGVHTYIANTSLDDHEWTLSGAWLVEDERIVAQTDDNIFAMNITAQDMYIVASGENTADVAVFLNGESIAPENAGADVVNGTFTVNADKLYHIVHLPALKSDQLVEFHLPAGVSLYAATFGS